MADGPDDPKQKADKAWRWCERQWDRAPSPSQMVEAAVTASIEAALAEALAPVLERVARLEELAQFPTLMAENDALLQKMADAPCATCGGARWVCDVSVDGASYHRSPCPECSKPAAGPEGTLQHNPGLGSVTMSTEQAAALLKSSKPAEPEGEVACTRHGQHRCPTCAAGMAEETPAALQGGPRAPERIRLQFRGGTPFIGGTLQPALNVSDAEYVRADLLEAATVLATTRYQAIQTLEADRQHLTNALRASTDKLASAERRIVDCRHEAMLEVLHEAENPSQTPIEHMITHDVVVARAEGREAGIREAAEVARAMRDADTGPSEYAQGARQGLQLAGRRILALLAKKPEVGT